MSHSFPVSLHTTTTEPGGTPHALYNRSLEVPISPPHTFVRNGGDSSAELWDGYYNMLCETSPTGEFSEGNLAHRGAMSRAGNDRT